MERKESVASIVEAVQDPTAKLMEHFYENYGNIQILRQFSGFSPEDASDQVGKFLSGRKGRKVLAKWREDFARTFNSLDEAVSYAASGANIRPSEWEAGVEATTRALNTLAMVIEDGLK